MGVPCDANGDLLHPGYWIKVVSSTYRVWHHGIVRRVHLIGTVYYVEIIHNVKNDGVTITTLEEFSQGNPISIHRRPSSPQHTEFVLATAEANIGKPYLLFSQNCEHFCWYCYTQQKKSEAVEALVRMGAVLGAVGLFAAVFGDSD